MSLQALLDNQALNMLPVTSAYIAEVHVTDRNRAGHHRYVAIQACLNTSVCLDNKSESELADFDEQVTSRLKNLDAVQ